MPPASTGAVLAAIGASDPVLVVALTAAGLLEGAAALGAAQARVLSRDASTVNRRDWVLATAAGFAWFVGMGGAALIGSGIAAPAVLLRRLHSGRRAGTPGHSDPQVLTTSRWSPHRGGC